MKEILKQHCGFENVEIKRLNGYENVNYRITTEAGKFVFKTYAKSKEMRALVEAENEVLLYLQEDDPKKYPKPIPFKDGATIKYIEIEGKERICRMLTYLEGQFWGGDPCTPTLFRSLGSFLAQMNLHLQKFDQYVIRARQWEWDMQYLYLNKKYIREIHSAENRAIATYFFQQFEENVVPILPELRKSIIQNDANGANLLTNHGQVTGIIDFGDLAYTPLIHELAIAITYACYDKEDLLKWASILVRSYHEVLPLEEKEISILYYLIAGRLCTTTCNSAHSKKINPDNTYAYESESWAWKMLHRLLKINPIHATTIFREAVGLPVEQERSVGHAIKQRHAVISPALSLSYSEPIYMDRSAFQYMYDIYGHTYLDAYNNIPHVGHSHPNVVAAGQRQMAKLNTNTRYVYDALPAYAVKLLAKFPDKLNKVFFVNSGSAASDLAIRLAHTHTGHEKIMVVEHGYHGNTQNGIDISAYKFDHRAGQGRKGHILMAEIPDTYRGRFTDLGAGERYADKAILEIKKSDAAIAAFISEPIVGCGGQVPLAPGYLKKLYPEIRKQGGVCISDEVQTGFGRLGDYFWGYEMQEVVPDIVILGKPMGNGHPMGAVITTKEIAESFDNGVEFFSSFGGNPVSCAIGLAVLDTIEEEKLQENAKRVGDYYKSLLTNLQNEFSCIGDIRGSGLFLGVEIVKDKESKEPDPNLAKRIKNELRNRHILISTDGPADSVLKTKPPLCFTTENAEQVVDNIRAILKIHDV